MGLLPASSPRRRGVTLPELLIVLVLLGLASAIVLPLARRSVPRAATDDAQLVADARRVAIGHAQPVRLRLAATGGWSVTATGGAVLAAGTVPPGRPAMDVLIDPLGGCVPAASPMQLYPMDPITCVRSGSEPRP